MDLSVETYRLTSSFPRDERFGLVSQMRRSSVSIPSNIAEGFSRFSRNEFRRFLLISKGPCAELEAQVKLSLRLKFSNQMRTKAILESLNHEVRMINRMIEKISSSQ